MAQKKDDLESPTVEIDPLDEILMPTKGKSNTTAGPESRVGHGEIIPSKVEAGSFGMATQLSAIGNPYVVEKDPSYEQHLENIAKALSIRTQPVKVSFGGDPITIPAEARDIPNAMHMESNQKVLQLLKVFLGDDLLIAAHDCAQRCNQHAKLAVWIGQKIQESTRGHGPLLAGAGKDLDGNEELWGATPADEDPSSNAQKALRQLFGESTYNQLEYSAKGAGISVRAALRALLRREINRIDRTDKEAINMREGGGLSVVGLQSAKGQ